MTEKPIRYNAIYRFGNKQNDLKYFKSYLPSLSEVDLVVEPFAGSFALIRNIYHSPDIKRLIIDKDEELIDYIENVRDDPEGVVKKVKDIDALVRQDDVYRNQLKRLRELKKQGGNDIYHDIIASTNGVIKKIPLSFEGACSDTSKLLRCNTTVLRGGCFQQPEFIEALDNPRAFIFFDPPYISSYNQTYKLDDVKDETQVFIDIKNAFKTAKAKCMMIINSNAITKEIYGEFVRGQYDKIYQAHKKKAIHLILTNYVSDNNGSSS